jgi:ribosomal protein L21E
MPRPLSTRTPEEILAKRRAYRKAYYDKNREKISEYYKHYSKGLGSRVKINPRVCAKCGGENKGSGLPPSKLQVRTGRVVVVFD